MNLLLTPLTYTLPLLLIALPGLAEVQQSGDIAPFIYQITVDKKPVGEYRYRTTRSDDGGYIIMVQSNINTEGWLDNIKQDTSHIERYGTHGKLLEIDRKIFDGSKVDWLQVKRQDSELWGWYTEVKNLSQKEEDELTDLSVSIVCNAIPVVGNLLTASQLLFSGREKPAEGTRFSENDSDTSFENLPLFWQKRGGTLPRNIRVLDSDTLEITEFDVMTDGDDYQFSDDNSNTLKLSFTTTASNIPAFRTISGADSDGTFSLTLQNAISTEAP